MIDGVCRLLGPKRPLKILTASHGFFAALGIGLARCGHPRHRPIAMAVSVSEAPKIQNTTCDRDNLVHCRVDRHEIALEQLKIDVVKDTSFHVIRRVLRHCYQSRQWLRLGLFLVYYMQLYSSFSRLRCF